MRNPNKTENRFCSKLFKALTLYMVIVLCTFFGYIMIFGNVQTDFTLPSGDTSADEQTKFESLLGEIMSATNLDADINLTISSNDLDLGVEGNLKFDIKSFDFSTDLAIKLNDSDISLKAFKNSDLDDFVYLTLNGNSYKLNLEEADLSSILSDFDIDLSSLVDMDALLDALSRYTGVDLKNLDVNELLSQLEVEETETENGYTFTVFLGSLKATLNCDKEYNNLSLKLREINIKDFYINLSVGNMNINAPNFDIDDTPNGDETDLTSLTQIIENAKLTDNVYAVSGDLNVKYLDNEIDGTISAVLVKDGDKFVPYLRFNANIKDINIYAYLVDDTIYLSVDNINIKFNLTETSIDEVKDFIENDLGVEFDAGVLETINVILPALEDVHINWLDNGFEAKVSEITVENMVKFKNIVLQAFLKTENDNILPDSLNLNADIEMLNGNENLNGSINFALSNVEIGKNANYLADFNFDENYSKLESLVTNLGETKLSEFIKGENLIDMASNFVDVQNLTFNLNTTIKSEETSVKLEGKIKFDISTLSFNAMLTAEFDGAIIDLTIYGEDIKNTQELYLVVAGKSLKLDLKQLDIQALTSELGVSAETANILETISKYIGIDLVNFDIGQIPELLKELYIYETETDKDISYEIAFRDYKVSLNFDKVLNDYDLAVNELFIEELYIKLAINNLVINDKDFAFDYVPTGTEEDITSLFNIVDNMTLRENTYAISGDLAVRYSTTSFYGNVLAILVKDGENLVPYVRVYTSSMNLSTYIYLLDNEVYVDLQGLRIKVDLSENSLNEIMDFLAKFGINIDSSMTSSFNIVLPALKNISFNWIEGGMQINVNDNLWYGENSYFADIVIQAFGQSINNEILPTQIVLGANIVDPNTDIYDSYEGYLLKDEQPVTQNKNFAVYLDNVLLGKNVNYVNDIQFDSAYENVTLLNSNSGLVSVDEFNDISVVLESFEAVENYIFSYEYQMNLEALVNNIAVGGSVRVDVTENDSDTLANDDEGFTLFGGKNLEVQGDFKIDVTNQVVGEDSSVVEEKTTHRVALLYDSDETDSSGAINEDYGGLYFSYAHGEFLDENGNFIINSDENTKDSIFRGRIKNANMSDMISMILGFMNIQLDAETMESWNLKESTTDFSYIHSLLGMDKQDVSGDVDIDAILSDVSFFLDMLNNINLTQSIDVETGLKTVKLEISLNEISLSEENKINSMDNNLGTLTLILQEEQEIVEGITVNKLILRELSAENITIDGQTIDLIKVEFSDFDSGEFNYLDIHSPKKHHDLSNLPTFMDMAVNTLNTKNFTFNGTVSIDMLGLVTLDMGLDLYISIEDINNPYIFAQVELQTSTIASWVFNGDFDTRIITYEYNNGNLTFHRYSVTNESGYWKNGWLWTIASWTKVVEDSVSKNTYASSEILDNITQIVLDSFGIKESFLGINIPNMIMELINSIEINPTLEETLLAFSADETCENMTLTLDGASLLGDDSAEDMNINLGAKKYAGYYVDSNGNKIDKVYSFIDSITGLTIDITGVSVTFDLYSNNDADSYATNAYQLKSSYEDNSGTNVGGKLLYTNHYYRNQYMNSVVM